MAFVSAMSGESEADENDRDASTISTDSNVVDTNDVDAVTHRVHAHDGQGTRKAAQVSFRRSQFRQASGVRRSQYRPMRPGNEFPFTVYEHSLTEHKLLYEKLVSL